MITLTPTALKAVGHFIATASDPVAGLRIHIQGGGCSGMQYGMKLESERAEDDDVLEIDGVTLFIDPYSAPLLDGVVIDYVDSLSGTGFRFDNPNATGGCACGQSFSA
ncbi:MAG: iron-sulfur cluster assembly accessory protein [Azoarcus sp.]|jgi:iron-sulfur cluster assembly protein|nr:iron-sulfur cluster assembly accessory protein [Azoarcus sp.]